MENLKKKILIIDSSGMAGHVISKYLGDLDKYQIADFECDPLCNSYENYIDVYDRDLLRENIKKTNPDVIINCLRILIEESETNVDKAIYFNSFIPHYLSKIGKEINAKVIQLSTDCVFSGKKGSYNEDDFKDGENVYARTKSLGELINERDLTLRTSFIGPNINGKNEELFHWFLMQRGEINGYSNAYWTGITTLELAKSIDKAIDLNLIGLYHLVPDEKISKFDLLTIIKNIWGKKDISINKSNNKFIDKSLVDNKKMLNVNNYSKMFEDLYNWMIKYKYLYPEYYN
ncbi:MAG: sugar nucleotide-binding protein [Ignavibacteria bacterium]|nr:sugar nucleotide-binding protein [Ignavibacteria bacterium]